MMRRPSILPYVVIFAAAFSFVGTSALRAQDQPAEPAATAEAEKKAGDDQPETEKKQADAPKQESDAQPEKPPATSEDKPAEKPAEEKPAEKKAEEKPAPEKPAEPAAGKSPAELFQAKLDQWKQLIKDMRALKQEYDGADDSQLPGLLQRWNDMLVQGDQYIGELRILGGKAYVAAPGEDRELSRFLAKLLEDDIQRDRYEEAAGLALSMLEAGCDDQAVVMAGGVAAFCTNQYEAAEKYLTQARDLGSLSPDGNNYLALLPEYRKYWEEESAIRKKEAEADDLPRVKITTNRGEIVLELFENEAPQTVGNFISLVEKKFYDGLTFHRVLPGFMAQGGCPQGTGTGGPGYNIYCEWDDNENYRRHFRGTLSMAHAGPDTGGSQFFITFVPTANLNARHTAFGRVIEGMDVLARIRRIDPQKPDPRIQPDRMLKVEVVRKREHEYRPTKVQ